MHPDWETLVFQKKGYPPHSEWAPFLVNNPWPVLSFLNNLNEKCNVNESDSYSVPLRIKSLISYAIIPWYLITHVFKRKKKEKKKKKTQKTLTLKMLSNFPNPSDLEIFLTFLAFLFPAFTHLLYFRAAILLKSTETLIRVSATQDE